MTFKLGMAVDLCITYLLMLFSMTLTLIQDQSGSAKAKMQWLIISTTKQATSITLATTVGHVYVTLTLQTCIWLDYLVTFPRHGREFHTICARKLKERSPNVSVLRFGALNSFSHDERRGRDGS